MNRNGSEKKGLLGERIFNTVVTLVVTVLAFWGGLYASDRGYEKAREEQKAQVVRALHVTVRTDLVMCSPTTDGIRDKIKARKFPINTYLLENLYHPPSVIPFGSEIGCLELPVRQKVATYGQKLRLCEDYRQAFLTELSKPDSPRRLVALFCYYMGLESVVSEAEDVLVALHTHYPELIPAWSVRKRPHVAKELARIIEEETDKAGGTTGKHWRFQIEEAAE